MRYVLYLSVVVLGLALAPVAGAVGLSGIPDDLQIELERVRDGLTPPQDKTEKRALKAAEKALAKLALPAMDESYAREIRCVGKSGRQIEKKIAFDVPLVACLGDCANAYVALLNSARDRLAAAVAGSVQGASETKKLERKLRKADKGLARAARANRTFKRLARLVKVAKLVDPYIVLPPPPDPVVVAADDFTGFMGGDGEIHWLGPNFTGHARVLAGLPQQGYDGARLPGFHWSNSDRWLIGSGDTDDYGFRDHVDGYVVVQPRNSTLVPGSASFEQNDGWFRFKVRVDAAVHDEIAFLLELESSHGINHWFDGTNASWDWVVYRALYRVIPAGVGSVAGPWLRTEAPVVQGGPNSRTPRALFNLDLDTLAEHAKGGVYHIEFAQGLPYDLLDRSAFFEDPTRTPPPGVHVEKIPLGPAWTPAFGGLELLAGVQQQHHELYAIGIYKDPFATDVITVSAGVHYEPPSMFVLEGLMDEILANPDVLDNVSFVLFPAANPDAWEWGNAHVRPWGDGLGELENGGWWHEPWQADPEAAAIRDYFDHMIDNEGVTVLVHVDLHVDLAPHPIRWEGTEIGEPPTYGYLSVRDTAAEADAAQFVQRLRQHPYSKPYTRPLDDWPSYSPTPRPGNGAHHFELPVFYTDRDIAARIVMEYDETALYRAHGDAPPAAGLDGLPTSPPLLLREPDGPHGDDDKYWVDGYIDDPVVYRNWGRELLDALMHGFVN